MIAVIHNPRYSIDQQTATPVSTHRQSVIARRGNLQYPGCSKSKVLATTPRDEVIVTPVARRTPRTDRQVRLRNRSRRSRGLNGPGKQLISGRKVHHIPVVKLQARLVPADHVALNRISHAVAIGADPQTGHLIRHSNTIRVVRQHLGTIGSHADVIAGDHHVAGLRQQQPKTTAAQQIAFIHIECVIAAVSSNPSLLGTATDLQINRVAVARQAIRQYSDIITGYHRVRCTNPSDKQPRAVADDHIALIAVVDPVTLRTNHRAFGAVGNDHSLVGKRSGRCARCIQTDVVTGNDCIFSPGVPDVNSAEVRSTADHVAFTLVGRPDAIRTNPVAFAAGPDKDTKVGVQPGDAISRQAHIVAGNHIVMSFVDVNIGRPASHNISLRHIVRIITVVRAHAVMMSTEGKGDSCIAIPKRYKAIGLQPHIVTRNHITRSRCTGHMDAIVLIARNQIALSNIADPITVRTNPRPLHATTQHDSSIPIPDARHPVEVRPNAIARNYHRIHSRKRRGVFTINQDPGISVPRNQITLQIIAVSIVIRANHQILRALCKHPVGRITTPGGARGIRTDTIARQPHRPGCTLQIHPIRRIAGNCVGGHACSSTNHRARHITRQPDTRTSVAEANLTIGRQPDQIIGQHRPGGSGNVYTPRTVTADQIASRTGPDDRAAGATVHADPTEGIGNRRRPRSIHPNPVALQYSSH